MLYPLRIDVSSKDGKVRLVDSMLIDPTCLPIPPCPEVISSSPSLFHETIDQNAKHLALTFVADMEVHQTAVAQRGGRVQLLEPYPELAGAAENQISRQLRVILEEGGPFSFSNRAKLQGVVGRRKRKRVAVTDARGHIEDNTGDKLNESKKKYGGSTFCPTDNLVRVNIRIRENKVSVVDELMVDPSHPTLSNPLFLARSIAADLKLPASMINTVAVSIAEQICGLSVDESLEGMLKLDHQGSGSSSNQSKAKTIIASNFPSRIVGVDKDVPSAWLHDEKEDQKMKDAQFGEIPGPYNNKKA